MYKYFLIILFCVGTISINSQMLNEYYNYVHYTTESGLPHSLVFDVKQSKDGFVWVATNNGLGRFDGYSFKTFRPNKEDKNSISGKSVSRLFLDSKKNLWLSIQGIGLNKMVLDNEQFASFSPTGENSISGNDVFEFVEDSDTTLWIGTNNGVDYFDTTTQKFVSRLNDLPQGEKRVTDIRCDLEDRIWFNASGQLGWVTKKDNKIHSLSEIISIPGFDDKAINTFTIYNKNKLWVATRSFGLFCVDLKSQKLIFHTTKYYNTGNLYCNKRGDLFFSAYLPINQILVIPAEAKSENDFKLLFQFDKNVNYIGINYCEDTDGTTWFTSNQGLYRVNTNFTISLIQSKSFENSDILTQGVVCSYMDAMGNLWLSTRRKGLVMIDTYQKKFTQYKDLKVRDRVIGGDNISMVYQDSRGKIWTGCYSEGISIYDPITKQSTIIPYDLSDKTKIIFNGPAGITEDMDGNIWIGFYEGALAKINYKTLEIEYFTDQNIKSPNYFRGSAIRSLIFDSDHTLWIAATSCGLVKLNTKTKEFTYISELYEKNAYNNSHLRYMHKSKNGKIWVGTQNGGLIRYNPVNNQFTHFTYNPTNPTTISGNTVYFIHEESDSITWVGTDKGLDKLNTQTEIFMNQSFDIEGSGSLCAVYRIYPDESNNLWLSGDCGIIKYNPTTFSATKYLKEDGLPSTEFNTTAGCKTRDGEIFFGTSRGLVSFFPNAIKVSQFPSKPLLTNLKIFNQSVSPNDTVMGRVIFTKDISLVKKITLPHNLSDFTIEFSAMHFSAPERNQYFHKLVGHNTEWIKSNSSHRWANYTGLAPGNYTFFLESTNNDGLLSLTKDMVELQIEILPPYYATWWFRTIIILSIILIILAIFKIRLNNIRKQKALLEKMVEVRTLELNEQNSILEERQEEIAVQNEELERHRTNLEELVDKRTIALQNALIKAEETDRLKSAFVANMSHEIRTPMNAILGFTGLLFDEELTTEEKNTYANIILTNGESLLNLLNDLLDRSVIESGQLRLHKHEVNINKVIDDVTQSFSKSRLVQDNSDLEIIIEPFESDPKIVITDPIRLAQILNNLISNALKFTSKGHISISYKTINDKIQFSVADTGIGIDQQSIDFIFDRFHKIENPKTVFYRGAGLGLSICQTLVEMLGGEISVVSKKGEGSCFTFTIQTT